MGSSPVIGIGTPMREWYSWSCPRCGASGGAATREDADLLAQLHASLVHSDD